jgi:hypothetical protein
MDHSSNAIFQVIAVFPQQRIVSSDEIKRREQGAGLMLAGDVGAKTIRTLA